MNVNARLKKHIHTPQRKTTQLNHLILYYIYKLTAVASKFTTLSPLKVS